MPCPFCLDVVRIFGIATVFFGHGVPCPYEVLLVAVFLLVLQRAVSVSFGWWRFLLVLCIFVGTRHAVSLQTNKNLCHYSAKIMPTHRSAPTNSLIANR